MPWPMPRWVISSASHMTKAVPAVMIATMKRPELEVELGDQVDVEAEQRLVVTVEGVDESGRLQAAPARWSGSASSG